MKLQHIGIDSLETWKQFAPPQGGEKQWKDGRSAKELARYITKSLPDLPEKLADAIDSFAPGTDNLTWAAEYVTKFPSEEFGRGEGRHHDMVLFNEDVFIGIEAKADEPFDKALEDWLGSGEGENAPANRHKRADAMCKRIFGDTSEKFKTIRYQLLSAMTGVLLEAETRKVKKAALIVLTFKKPGSFKPEKARQNDTDFNEFVERLKLDSTEKCTTCKADFDVYVRHITIDL